MSKALWAILLSLCLLAAAARADPVSPADDQTLPRDTAVLPAPNVDGSGEPTAAEGATDGDPNTWRIGGAARTEGEPAGTTPSLYREMMRLGLSLFAVLAVVVGAVWAFRRFAPRTAAMYSSDNLKVMSRTYLGPKQAVYLVKTPASLLILGATEASIRLLTEIKDPNEMARAIGAAESACKKSAVGTFRSLLSGVTSTRATDRGVEDELAATVKSVADRFADLNRKLDTLEESAD